MFDSDNVPLVTRVEAGAGVIVNYTMNNGEGVWNAMIDSDWLLAKIAENVMSDSERKDLLLSNSEAKERLEVLESILGVNYVEPISPTVIPEVIKTIELFDVPAGGLSNEMKITFKILAPDLDPVVMKNITFAQTSSLENVLVALAYALKTDAAVNRYLSSIVYKSADTIIEFAVADSYPSFTVQIDVVEASAPSYFVVTQ